MIAQTLKIHDMKKKKKNGLCSLWRRYNMSKIVCEVATLEISCLICHFWIFGIDSDQIKGGKSSLI